jgi:hypothetical protein
MEIVLAQSAAPAEPPKILPLPQTTAAAMTYRALLPLALLCLACAQARGQAFQPVFPGLSGQELLDSLFDRYRPVVVLDYANARDTLYASVLSVDDDSLRCIYSGHTLYLDPNADPTQYIYLGGGTNGMNTEHAYPQSKGAGEGNARSDMHHIFPTRIAVNEARGDAPYQDIPDAQTQRWFINNQFFTSPPPAQSRDQYSEWRTGAFEPREAVKGDVARAVFYFYTMYRNQANAADPNYFELQRPTLCLWNQLDPADAAELLKTWRIAAYQEGKPNPYVLDCNLAARSWCSGVAPNCSVAATEPAGAALRPRLLPHPAFGLTKMEMNLPFPGSLRLRVFNSAGQQVADFQQDDVFEGAFSWPLDFSALQQGAAWVGMMELQLLAPGRQLRTAMPLVVWGK